MLVCSHYKVIAVPVTRARDQPRTIPYQPVVPLPELLNHTLSRKLVTKVVERVPFFVGEYQSEELPPTLKVAGKWVHKAFKTDTYYSFVVVAFTKVCGVEYVDRHTAECFSLFQSSSELLHTISEPADPPVLIGISAIIYVYEHRWWTAGHDEVREAVMKKKRVTRRFGNTVLATMLSVLGIFAAAFLLIFVSKYYQSSKRDAY